MAGGPKEFEYFRFNIEEDLFDIPIDACKKFRDNGRGGKCSTFSYINLCTQKELEKPQVQEQLQKLAKQLVERRRQRIKDDYDRWERFACCTTYTCTSDDCRVGGEALKFNLRREMKDHLQAVHEPDNSVQSPDLEAKLDLCRKLPDYPGGPF